MVLPFDDLLQCDIAILILQVEPPTRDLVDIGSVDRLPDTANTVEAGLWKTSLPMALGVFQFSKGVEELSFQVVR